MSDYGQGAIDLMEILGVDAEAVVGDLMEAMHTIKTQCEDRVAAAEHKYKLMQALCSSQRTTYEARIESQSKSNCADADGRYKAYKAHLDEIDDIAANNDIKVKCRSCDEYYYIDFALSEYKHDMSYCGRNERCCP